MFVWWNTAIMPKAICAYTSATPTYPEYLSVNSVDGKVEFTVRGAPVPPTKEAPYTRCGPLAAMAMAPEFAVQIARNILSKYTPQKEPLSDNTLRSEFIRGAQLCREAMARMFEVTDDTMAATAVRACWSPFWGPDPGVPVPQARAN